MKDPAFLEQARKQHRHQSVSGEELQAIMGATPGVISGLWRIVAEDDAR